MVNIKDKMLLLLNLDKIMADSSYILNNYIIYEQII